MRQTVRQLVINTAFTASETAIVVINTAFTASKTAAASKTAKVINTTGTASKTATASDTASETATVINSFYSQ